MGKRSFKEKDGDTKTLFKKSQHTIFTQSKTCSGISQTYSRGGTTHIKRNLSQTHNNTEEKIKRDLSIETDICILKRYYKKKKNRLSTQDGSKSKYSTVLDTEIDTNEQSHHDNSACGDSEYTETNNVQCDIAKMMMDNFKQLLNNWIENYLLDNKDTKGKLDTIMYSLLHKTELNKTSTSSSTTYVLNRESLSQRVKNKKVATSIICQYCKNENWIRKSKINRKESSSHSTPASNKNIKLISTLSIPKNLHKQVRENKSNNKITKTKQRNVILAINESSKLLEFSSLDLLTISTKSFTKRCATFNCDSKKKKRKKKRHIVFFPKPFYKSATDSTTDENKHLKKNKLPPMPSLMRSIYAGDPANITSTDDHINYFRNNFTMTEENKSLAEMTYSIKLDKCQSKTLIADTDTIKSIFIKDSKLKEADNSKPMTTIDFMNENPEFPILIESKTIDAISKIEELAKHEKATKKAYNDTTSFSHFNQIVKKHKLHSRKTSKLSKKEKKKNININEHKKRLASQKFLSHCQNIFQYFTEYENKNNMKLDIHITMLPVNNFENKSTHTSKQDLNSYEKNELKLYNVEPTFLDNTTCLEPKHPLKNAHNIIPLLDGADNQEKYIFKSGSGSEQTAMSQENNAITTERSTITDDDITNEINALKSIIKELKNTTEVIIKDHKQKGTTNFKCNSYNFQKYENISKAVQFSKEISKHPLLSGIKLTKEPKKPEISEFYDRVLRKSNSYNIIDSEFILRVTDMTSAANEINKMNKSEKSFPNSKSMVDIRNCSERKKLYTYYCENTSPTKCTKTWLKSRRKKNPQSACVIDSGERLDAVESSCCSKESYENCSYYDEDDEEKCIEKKTPCHRTGMGFGEGCVYCMLMWIPVVLIACLFYSYVIKELMQPKTPVTAFRANPNVNKFNNDSIDIKLSDLGF